MGSCLVQVVQVPQGQVLATAEVVRPTDLPSSAGVLRQTIPLEVALDSSSSRPLEWLERGTLVEVCAELA